MTPVRDIVNAVITQLSMVGSFSTQVYAGPRIQQHVEDAVIMLMDEVWWPHLMSYGIATLDGTTGSVIAFTPDLTLLNHAIKRYEDIEFVVVADTERRLSRLPSNVNPYNITGGDPLFMSPMLTGTLLPMQVWPHTATGNVVVRAKLYPSLPLSADDVVYLDKTMVMYAAAYFYSQDDGTNPGAIDKFKNLLDKRLMQVKRGFEHQHIPLSGPGYTGADQWQEALR